MGIVTANSYLGLWQGPIDNNASSVINAVADVPAGNTLNIGSGVYVASIAPDTLLPGVDEIFNVPTSLLFIGITVGGDLKGTYGEVGDGVAFITDLDAVDVIAVNGDAVRVCTQGRCVARVKTNIFGAIDIGDALGVNGTNEGTLTLATSGQNVIARALQAAPLDGSTDDLQYIAVDVQREGVAP